MPDLTPEVVPARRPGAAWYLLALAPIAIAGAIAAVFGLRLYSDIKDMPRVVVPGERDLTLEAGDYVGYLEGKSVVDGVSYNTASWSGNCRMTGPNGEIKLESSSTSTSYSLGSYAGQSTFVLTIPTTGAYHVACSGPEPSAVLAIGHGIGMGIVVMVVSAFGGFIGAIVVLVMVRRRRKRR